MYSPRWLFFYPGVVLTVIGTLLSLWLLPHEQHLGRFSFDVDTLAYTLGLALIGTQIMVFAVSAKLFGTRAGFLPPNATFEAAMKKITLETGLVFGVLFLLGGLALAITAVYQWHAAAFGLLTATRMLRLTLPSAGLLMLGVEIIFASFFLSLLEIKHR